MFDRESWFNSYTTIFTSWGTSTLITFEQTILSFLRAYFGLNVTENINDLLTIKSLDDLLKLLTWVFITGMALASSYSRWSLNKADKKQKEADCRLKNAEAEAIEKGWTEEELENTKAACREDECFFIKYYSAHQSKEIETKVRQEIEANIQK